MSEYISIAEIEALTERDEKVLLVQTEQIVTPDGIWPPVIHIIKDPKKVREKIGNKLIRSVQWMNDVYA
jgi:hypothetical protein